MNTTLERLNERVSHEVNAHGRTHVDEHELVRHPVYTRVVHWSAAIFFVLALLSGFALYSAWLYRWLTPLFGGGPMTRFLHPWFSLAFVLCFALQILNWLEAMAWTTSDRQWFRRMRTYVSNVEPLEPEYVGFFNAGQKLYFWAIVASIVLFVLSGFPMWLPDAFGRAIVAISYVIHDIAALVMLVGFIVHVYEGTAAMPGTFRSMVRGTVERRWAWTHHPAWYRRATGRDPRADHDAAAAELGHAESEPKALPR